MDKDYKKYLDGLSEQELWFRLAMIDICELESAFDDGIYPFEHIPNLVEEAKYIENKLGVAGKDHPHSYDWDWVLDYYESKTK